MIDPNDPGTLDLIEACSQPLDGAERQRKLRRDRKAAGLKPMYVGAAERELLETLRKLRQNPAPGTPEGKLSEAHALAEHYRQQREGLQTENQRLIGCLAELQQLAEDLGGPPMKMEKDPLSPRELRRQIEALEQENALLESERNKAYAAIKTWENRLRAAGQSTDYRPLPGELGGVTVTPGKV
jgi:DNA repair exonuclease SbcCD ATPase subunit